MSLDALASSYSDARARLHRVAYSILGSREDADDIVAEAWLRLVQADRREPVRDVVGWGTVTVARMALDQLKSARVKREAYVGPWLPEPLVTAAAADPDPADRVTLDDTVRYALLVVLEQLSPAERTSWVLHDLFGMSFEEIGATVGRSPAAARQLARRARQHMADNRPRFEIDRSTHRHVVEAFLAAAAGGDLGNLVGLLDPDAVLTADGGGVVSSARRPVVGAENVARFVLGLARRGEGLTPLPVLVNGDLGLAVYDGARLDSVFAFTVDQEQVVRIDIVRAPAKLAGGSGGGLTHP